MPKTVAKFDWLKIRAMYEAGNSPAYIENLPGMPSRQAIHQRAEKEHWERIEEIADELDVIPFEGLTDQQRIVIREIARGLPARHAAAIAGCHENTVSRWRQLPEFERSERAAVAVFTRGQMGKMVDSTDWRAGLALLERHPQTRTDFAPPNGGQGKFTGNTFNVLGQVNLGIPRDEPETANP